MVFGVSEVNGKNSMKPEDAQRKAIEEGTGAPCPKSDHVRIHEETLEMTKKCQPYSGEDADFEWTEDLTETNHFWMVSVGFFITSNRFPRPVVLKLGVFDVFTIYKRPEKAHSQR